MEVTERFGTVRYYITDLHLHYVKDSCEYTHDISSDMYADMPSEEWHCPYDSADDSGFCPFHAEDVRGDTVEKLLSLVKKTAGPVRIFGAEMGAIDIDYATLDGPSNHPIDLREATIRGSISAKHATINRPLDFRGAELLEKVDFEAVRFNRRVDFGHARFEGDVTLRLAKVGDWFDLREAYFKDTFFARVATFEAGIYAEDAVFDAPVEFKNAEFEDVVNFCSVDLNAGAIFELVEFEHDLHLDGCNAAEFRSRPDSVTESSITSSGPSDGAALSLGEAIFHRGMSITNATLAADISLQESKLAGQLRTGGCKAKRGTVTVNCTGVETVSGEIETGNRISYNLTDATVGDLTLSNPEHVTSLQFRDTRFDGFRFDLMKSELRDNGWQLHEPENEDELSPEQLENLYLRAKNGAKEIGATAAAAKFFVREMRYRRASHRRRILTDNSILDKGRAVVSWSGNIILSLTCGYGERPLRPLAFSVVVIFVYAALFALADASISYSTPHGYLIFSVEGFVSLLVGQPETTDGTLSFLIVSESFIGAAMIALLVFTLTRSVSR